MKQDIMPIVKYSVAPIKVYDNEDELKENEPKLAESKDRIRGLTKDVITFDEVQDFDHKIVKGND